MSTPSITPAQILAIVSSVLGLLVTVGLLDDVTSKAILGVAATVIPVALVLVDAAIRKARAENAAAILQAKAVDASAKAASGAPADPAPSPRAP